MMPYMTERRMFWFVCGFLAGRFEIFGENLGTLYNNETRILVPVHNMDLLYIR